MTKCRFSKKSSVIRGNFCTFALANSRRTDFVRVGAATGREHYIMECVADALFLAVLKLPQSNLVVVYTVPVGVPMANHAITHTFRGVLYIPTAWVSLCSFTTKGCGRPQTANGQKPDTPLFFCSEQSRKLNQSDSGCLADYE